MSAEGAWLAITPFFVAFAITLASTFTLPTNWMDVYNNIRRNRIEKRKAKGRNTTLQMLYGGLDMYWWLPIVIYIVCVGCAVLGIVFMNHAGYAWAGAAVPAMNIPLIYAGFWLVIILMSRWIADFLSVCIDRCSPSFLLIFGTWLLHLAVWISIVVMDPSNIGGWLQLPLFFAITLIFYATSMSFYRCGDRYVVMNKQDCTTFVSIEPACKND